VSKLSSVLTGDTLSERDTQVKLPVLEFPSPVHYMAAYPKYKADMDKITSALTKITEEDPSLNVVSEPDTLEMLLGGLGDVHVNVAVDKMSRKLGA
jgi:elongation factor G